MKVAISTNGKDLDSQIDPRFGRCAYFLIIETDDMAFEVLDNDSANLGGGAGIQSAQFIASKGAKAVLTGNCGPNAVRTLSAAGVELYTGETGTVADAIERYKNGVLKPTAEATVPDHHGMGGGTSPGAGRGQGAGGGMGMGRGRGMGRGAAASGQTASGQGNPTGSSREQEVGSLKEQAADLRKQVAEIEARIRKLE